MNIAALISGGVDSAVVVHLLCEQGYKPDLFYIKIGMDGDEDLTCTAEEDIELCTATARKYGLSLNIIDLHRQYWDNVVAYAIDKVKRGLTPNPDVMCNKLIKFGCFEQEAGHLYDNSRQLSEMIPFNSFKYSILLDTGAQRKIISQDENVESSVSKYCVNVPSSFAILRESISVSNP